MNKKILLILIIGIGIFIRVFPVPELTSGSISHNVGLTLAVASQSPKSISWQFLNNSYELWSNILCRIERNKNTLKAKIKTILTRYFNRKDTKQIPLDRLKEPIFTKGISESKAFNKAQKFIDKGLHDEPIDPIQIHLNTQNDISDKTKTLAYIALAGNYVEKGIRDNNEKEAYYNKAQFCFDRALKLIEKDNPYNISIYSGLGFIYYQYKNYDQAIAYLKKGLTYTSVGFEKQKIDIYTNLGCVYRELCQYEKAIECFNKALSLNPSINSQLVSIYQGLADSFTGLKNYDQAIICLKEGLSYASDGFERRKIDMYTNLGCVYRELCQYEKAIKYFKKALKLSPSLSLVSNIYYCLRERKRSISISFDQAPLRYIVLHCALFLGRSERVIRFPAFLFGIAGIFLIYKLGKLIFGINVGLLSSFLLSFSMWHIHHSSYAATYTLYMFLSLLSVFFFYKSLKEPSIGLQIKFIIASTLGFYSFYPFITVIFAEALYFFLFYRRDKKRALKFVISLFVIGILILPLLSRAYYGFYWKTNFGDYFWGWKSFEVFPFLFGLFGGIRGFIPINIFIFLLGLFAVFFKKVERKGGLLLFFLTIIPCLFFLGCFFLKKINLGERYFLFIYPFFIILSSYGILSVRKKIVVTLLIFLFNSSFVLFILNGFGFKTCEYIPRDYTRHYGDFKFLAEYLRKNYEEGDAVVITYDASIFATQYYLDKKNLFPAKIVRPSCGARAYYRYDGDGVKNVFGIDEYDGTPKRLNKIVNEYGRLWLVDGGGIYHNDKQGLIRKWIKENHSEKTKFKGGVIYFFDNKMNKQSSKKETYICTKAICFLDCEGEELEIKYPFNR